MQRRWFEVVQQRENEAEYRDVAGVALTFHSVDALQQNFPQAHGVKAAGTVFSRLQFQFDETPVSENEKMPELQAVSHTVMPGWSLRTELISESR